MTGSAHVTPNTAADAPHGPLSSAFCRASPTYRTQCLAHWPFSTDSASFSAERTSETAVRLPGLLWRQLAYRRRNSRSSTPSVSSPRCTNRAKSSKSATASSPSTDRAMDIHRRRAACSTRSLRSFKIVLTSSMRASVSSSRSSSASVLRPRSSSRALSSRSSAASAALFLFASASMRSASSYSSSTMARRTSS